MTTVTAHDLARRVVEALAPAELPSFALVAAPYLDHPERAERRLRRDHDDPLGSGPGDAVTPAVALVSGSVITALADGVGEAVKTGAGRVFRRLVKRRAVEAPVRDWSRDDLARVRATALVRAKSLGVEDQRAEALADAIIVALVLDHDSTTADSSTTVDGDSTTGYSDDRPDGDSGGRPDHDDRPDRPGDARG